jgi:protoporphyrinogen IX oxidase
MYWIYEVGKTIHFIGLISWFAGLFYLPRLFIYHIEALEKQEPEKSVLVSQFGLMEKRLYSIIMNPAMILTYIGGLTMIFYYGWEWFTANIWMHWKLGFVILLTGYHHYNKIIIRKLEKGEAFMTSNQLRFYNEIATILLLAIVLLAVFKSRLDFIYAFVTIIIFMFLLMLGIKAYKNYRKRRNEI